MIQPKKEKIVYILGAGFSRSAGAPMQPQIIKEMFSLTRDNLVNKDYCDLFFEYLTEFKKLLREIFFINNSEFEKFSLEDIYSIIDRCIIDNLALRSLNKIELIEIREKINALIIMLMDYKLEEKSQIPHIKKFAEHLVRIRKQSYEMDNESDPFTIISTNWDIIIENAMKKEIDLKSEEAKRMCIKIKEGIIDYCFYVHAFDEWELGKKLRSGLYWRGKDNYNIKVLKLHGSMNWLQCQKCQRVFITFFKKIALQRFLTKPTCNHCKNNFNNEPGSELLSVLIMPTFLKDLSIFQLKLSWQIAGIELQEATKIIFMGYSFPMADFEFRQLLARSLSEDAKIEVVLWETDDPKQFKPKSKILEFLPESRFRHFFGKRDIKFYYDGVQKYINDNY